MAYSIKQFLFLLIIIQNQCFSEKVKWCINSDYVADEHIIDKKSCKNHPCVISTCPSGQMNYNRACVRMDSKSVNFSEILTLFTLINGEPIKSLKTFDSFQVVTYKDKTVHLKENNNCTNSNFYTIGKGEIDGNFLDNGSFFIKEPRTILPPEEYIVRFTITNESGRFIPQIKLKFAKDVEADTFDQYMDLVFDYVMFASCFFMILVLAVYILCKELRTTAGLIFMTYVTTLAITFLLLPIRDLAMKYEKISKTGCYILSTLIHYVTFSSYAWMNIMGFDIWWTLRNMFYQRRPGNSNAVNYYKYTWYCGIAWIPTLIYVLIEICLDEFIGNGPLFRQCTVFSNKWYLAGPSLTLQALNFVPFVLIIYNLVRIQRSNLKHLNSADSNSTGPKQNALLSIKISITLGTNWFLDIMLLLFYNDLPDWLKYTPKMYNAAFGLILFLVYIIKANVLLKLFRRLSINNWITRHLERRVSGKHNGNARKFSQLSDSHSATVLEDVNLQPKPY